HDVHLLGMRGADLGAEDFFARAGCRGLRIELADSRVGLQVGIVIHCRRTALAANSTTRAIASPAAATTASVARRTRACCCVLRGIGIVAGCAAASSARWRCVLVVDALGVGAAVALELRFDPIDGGAVAVGALAAVAEFGETPDGGFVFRQVEPS